MIMISLTTAAGECMPMNGTISTCNQFSTAEPTTAPAKSPPMFKLRKTRREAPKLPAKMRPGTSAPP
ncbi:hypothetical protein Lal_00000137 [Lupinus albus]|nr:hypothetical protein Lal_00000137 [Lupinus albus]